jgi:hemolysin III
MMLLSERLEYSRAERVSDAAIHYSGLALVLVAVPVLITSAAFLRGDFTTMFAISVYGLALIAMIGCSALYNLAPYPGWDGLFQRMDHSAIYLKIAGTYTPFTMISGNGFWLLSLVWLAAGIGVLVKIASPLRFRRLALGLYLAMGWAGLAAGSTFLATLSTPVVVLIALGGSLYTVGVVFYVLDRLPFHYTIWHVCVLVASGVFFGAVYVHLIQHAA